MNARVLPVVTAVAAAAFVALLADVLAGGLLAARLDPVVFAWTEAHVPAGVRGTWAPDVLSFPGHDEVAWALLAVAGALLLAWRRAGDAVALVGGAFVGMSAAWGIKRLVARLRPPGAEAESFAFPSGHATTTAVVYALVLVLVVAAARDRGRSTPKDGVLLAAWAGLVALVGSARILAGMHWATDVAAGVALGASVAGATLLVRRALSARRGDGAGSRVRARSR